ncbi:MAG: hypothetical protein AAF660_13900 [Pseudomonadota bacterium]
MNITQKRFSNRTAFDFQEDLLEYTIKDKSGSRTFSVEYGAIETGSGEVEERNDWYRNVGLLWFLLGGFIVVSRFMETGEIKGSIWLTLGLVFLALYWILRSSYTTLDSEKGRIFIIKDDSHDSIKEEIETRRKNQWFRWYGTVDFSNEPQREIGKFQWLLDRDAITEDQFAEFRSQIIDYHSEDQASTLADDRTLN